MEATFELPGRLGDPNMSLGTDPRADSRMVAALAPLGLGDNVPAPEVTADSPVDRIVADATRDEAAMSKLPMALGYGNLPPIEGVESHTEVITGVDGNQINLYVHRPDGLEGTAPGVLHIHGGGMAILQASDPNYVHWRETLASLGLVCVGVEFRNAAGVLGPHPFPAGLNDCTSALLWMHANKAELGVSKIVVSGESGGGNLTLATTLRAAQEGNLAMIDGVYAQCPYISGAYADPPAELPSLVENDAYFISCAMMAPLVTAYDPSGTNRDNPLAWPINVKVEDLPDMPPHVISLNELDPLRDEGLVYYRKLVAAGVPTVGRMVTGTCHAGDVLMPAHMPDVYAASARDLAGFASSL